MSKPLQPAPKASAVLLTTISLVAVAVMSAGLFGVQLMRGQSQPSRATATPLLLAPLIGVDDTCIGQQVRTASDANFQNEAGLVASCDGPKGSAAALIESTLAPLAPMQADAANAHEYQLGYTLAVPLLTLFRRYADDWVIDEERVSKIARTLAQSPRSAVLYLFSTHFSAGAAIEESLASDPANIAQTQDGPLPISRYYGAPLYNWSVARTDNPLTARRDEALTAVLDAVCKLPQPQRERVKAVTVLGETHQLFPDFEAGMGFPDARHPYRITDYSPASVKGFSDYLRTQFGSLAQLNRTMGSHYATFEDVLPPSRDIRTEPLTRYTEHIDAFAQGTLPISGWTYVPPTGQVHAAPWVHVYRDGIPIGKVRADRGRQDVAQALPEVQRADTGWRFDMDFRHLRPGLHRIDVLLEQRPGELTSIGSRQIAIMDTRQQTPALQPQKALPGTAPMRDGVLAHLDLPMEQASYYFNPLVPFWHAFRGQQVARYLEHFSQQVGRSCLAGVPRYTHQIVPFSNPSWDTQKFAIEQSLQSRGSLRLGVSLYGDAAYGNRFAQWLRTTGHHTYGVTEFHPLRPMNPQRLQEVLQTHADDGAQFLSFFLEPRWHGALVPRAAHNPFSFDPDNAEFGSDVLYRSMQQILKSREN